MSNFGFVHAGENDRFLNVKRFRAAQTRVAVLMFMILGINIYISFTPFASAALMIGGFRSELAQAVMYLSYMAAPVFLFGIVSGRRPREYFNFRKGEKHTVAVGFFAMGVVYFAQLVAVVVSAILAGVGADPEIGSMQPTGDPALFVLRVVYVAVFPAVFEELAMRGIVMGELLPFGKGFALITSGLLFALMHMNPIQLPFAFIAGVAMGYAALYSGSLRVSVAVHFTNNFLSVLFLSLPSFMSPGAAFITEAAVSAVIFVAGTVAGVYLLRHGKKEAAVRKALCADTNEERRVDLRDGLGGKISPLLVIYVCASLLMTILTLVTYIFI